MVTTPEGKKRKVKRRRGATITRATVLAFYNAIRDGVFWHEPYARERIEARIFKAQLEGRIK